MSVVASLHLDHDRFEDAAAGLPFARTLVVAPHPDDESIGAGALLAHAAQRGAAVRVAFLTDGENNPWPQRAWRRRWRITADDRREWARMRRREARHALIALGVPPQSAVFLGHPDDGLTALENGPLVETLRNIIVSFHPTLLVVPSVVDFHPDHRAACRAALRALQTLAPSERPVTTLSYVVHGTPAAMERPRVAITAEERERKREAITNHATQLLLSRKRFLRYGARDEQYGVVSDYAVRDETLLVTCLTSVRHVLSVLR